MIKGKETIANAVTCDIMKFEEEISEVLVIDRNHDLFILLAGKLFNHQS